MDPDTDPYPFQDPFPDTDPYPFQDPCPDQFPDPFQDPHPEMDLDTDPYPFQDPIPDTDPYPFQDLYVRISLKIRILFRIRSGSFTRYSSSNRSNFQFVNSPDPELDFWILDLVSDLLPDQDSLPNAGSKTEPDTYLVSDVVIVRLSFVF
jgi:hypothetical protein